MALQIEKEAQRCLNCKAPMCQRNCPIATPIPHIIQLFKENRLMEAGEELFANNPLSVICATVCNHEVQCAGHCILGKKSTPVHFYHIEQFISDAYLSRAKFQNIEKKGINAAII